MPITDHYAEFSNAVDGPLIGGFPIVPGAGDLSVVTRAVMVGGMGDIAVILRNGDALTVPGLVPGTIYPLRLSRVVVAGTTATGIVGLY